MNKIYKLIWSDVFNVWIVVSELAKGNIKSIIKKSTISVSLIISFSSHANIIDLATPCNNTSSLVGTPIANDKGQQRAQDIGPVGGTGTFSTVTGCGATGGGSTGATGVTIYGSSAVARADFASAFGLNTQSATLGVAIGTNAWSLGSGSIALGFSADTSAAATNSIAIGKGADTSDVNTIAIGNTANASVPDSIALGANSATIAAVGSSFLINKTTTNGIVSVGSATITRRIQNVADGAADQDVATIAQLKVINSKLTNVATALGGGSNYDTATGVWTAPSYVVTNPVTGVTTTYNDIGSAISSNLSSAVNQPLTFKDNRGGTSVNKLGSEFALIGDSNITTTVSNGQVSIGLNKDLKGLNSVETVSGTNKSTLTAAGITVTDGSNTSSYGAKGLNINSGAVVLDGAGLNVGGVVISKSGINANNQQIINLADGAIAAGSKDVVNGGQLYAVNNALQQAISKSGQDTQSYTNNLTKNIVNALGGGSNYDTTTGVWTAPSYAVMNPATGVPSTYNDIGSAMSNLSSAVNQPLTFNDNRGGTSVNKLGSEFALIGDSNITVTVSNGQVTIGLNKDLSGLDSISMVSGDSQSTLNAQGLNVNGVVVSTDGINANNKAINNVANVTKASDAVNLGQVMSLIQNTAGSSNNAQLTKTYESLANSLGGDAKYEQGVWRAPTYTLGYGSSRTTVKDVGSAIQVLNQADEKLNSRIDHLSQRLEQVEKDTNTRISTLEKRVNAGIASALALESPAYVAGGLTYGVGASVYRGQSAVGISFRRTSETGHWSMNVGVSADSQGEPAFRIGMGGLIE